MEKFRLHGKLDPRSRSKYAALAQASADERDACASCGRMQKPASQGLRVDMTRAWLVLWTVYIALWGVLLVAFLALAKQYGMHYSHSDAGSSGDTPSLLSDQAFPKIPLRRVVWKVEQGFVDADPFDGQHWGKAGTEIDSKAWTPWDDIYDGSWIQVTPDETLGIPTGVPIQNFSIEAGGSWKTSRHGFSPSINHQIHCLGWIKHYLMPNGIHDIDYDHAGHCVEYLRHAIMCQGDLTLEKPENLTRWHIESVAYDETVHVCRDWTALSKALRETSLGFEYVDDRSLRPFDNSDWQPRQPVVPFEAV